MKVKVLMAIFCMGLFMLSSCGSSNGELTKSQAESALKEGKLLFVDNSWEQVTSLTVGYYQLEKADQRKMLENLASAGVITYSVVKVPERVKRGGGWNRPVEYVNVDRYFVSVQLTKDGQKLVVADPVTEAIDKDMVEKLRDKYAQAEAPAGNAQDQASASGVSSEDGNEKSDFQRAKERENAETVHVSTHKNKLIKVRDILCTEDMLKKGEATCNYIYEYDKVTPFGYFIKGFVEGTRKSGRASFTKYVDSGWKLN